MLEKASRRRGASDDVFGAGSNAISDTGGSDDCRTTCRSNGDDCCPRAQHVLSEGCPSARSSQHSSLPPAPDSIAMQTPRLMLVNSTSNSQLARRRRLPDMTQLSSASCPEGKHTSSAIAFRCGWLRVCEGCDGLTTRP